MSIAKCLKDLETNGLAWRGTELGALLQWAKLHIEELTGALAEREIEADTALAQNRHMHSELLGLMELVLTFNFGTLVKAEFQDRILYEVDLSPKSYFEVCWAHGWAGDYESEEEAREDCLSLCGYGRSIREVKPGDDGYKNPRQPKLTERRIPIYAAAGAAPKEPT